MWIEAVAPERIAELFDNYRSALVGPKGSECGCGKQSPQPEKTRDNPASIFLNPVKPNGAADSGLHGISLGTKPTF